MVFVWLDSEPDRIPKKVIEVLANPSLPCVVSAISAWELEVKFQLGKLDLTKSVKSTMDRICQQYAISCVALDRDACHQLPRLGNHHKDPFDRMLICHALSLGARLVTPDVEIAKYPVPVLW